MMGFQYNYINLYTAFPNLIPRSLYNKVAKFLEKSLLTNRPDALDDLMKGTTFTQEVNLLRRDWMEKEEALLEAKKQSSNRRSEIAA